MKRRAVGGMTLTELPTRGFLLASLVLGGAGLSNPLANWLVVALGLVVLGQRLPKLARSDFDMRARVLLWLLLASAGLCLLQMIPLPRTLWASLPGHQTAAEIVAATRVPAWTAWSLAPDRTFDALTALVPLAAALLIAAQADLEERLKLLRLVVSVALVGSVLAVIQLSAGPNSAPVLFATSHQGFGVGFFVNRNHFALFALFAMQIVALPAVPAVLRKVENPRAAEWGLRVGAFVLLTLGVLSTLSRAGITLLPVALVTAILLCNQGRVRAPVVAGGIVAAGLLALALRSAPPIEQLLSRFASAADDKRFEYWANTLDAIRDSLPLGTGFGTFTLIYPTYEPLNEVYQLIVNHAHGDLLELVLESGVPGAVLLLAWLSFVAFAVITARKAATSRRERLLPLVVAIACLLTLAASLVDYPVRMHTIAVTLGLLVGMLARVRTAPAAQPKEQASWLRRGLVWTPLVALAALTTSAQWGLELVRNGREVMAARVAPGSSLVQSAAASRYQLLGQVDASSRAARRALALAPLDAPAVRAEGMAALVGGRREQGAALMSLGAYLGWRDVATQLWLAEQALASGAYGFAVQRIDAIIRQDKFDAELLPLLPPLLRTAGGRAALAEQLAFQPGWRTAFFNAAARDQTWTMPQLIDLSARLQRANAPMTPTDTAIIRALLAVDGRYQDVRRTWQASGQRALIGEGGFDGHPGTLLPWFGPYGWYAPTLSGVRLDVAAADMAHKGQALAITSDGLANGVALVQTIVLAPGRYDIGLSVQGDDLQLLQQLELAVECRRDADTPIGQPIPVPLTWQKGEHGWQRAKGRLVVPSSCPGQKMTVSVPQNGGRPFSLWLDDVSIQSASAPGA